MSGKWIEGDSRKAFGCYLQQQPHEVKTGAASFADILDETIATPVRQAPDEARHHPLAPNANGAGCTPSNG
jgi:hypothetical protein